MTPERVGISKTLWEKEEMLVTSIFFPSPTMFSALLTEITISAIFELLSANDSTVIESKILLFGKGVKQGLVW